MTQYKVRSRDLVDLVTDIRSGAIILAPYFQRKLVWRLAHKIDFIKTILLGYPFPEIFLSRGTLDVVTMKSTSCIVDGQQRMNAINEFILDTFPVEDRIFTNLTQDEKERFLKYEVAIIDLDLPQNDPRIIEIFKRLNRTFYALSAIEKLSTEFGSSEFMLVAKMLCGELQKEADDENQKKQKNIDPGLNGSDPNISEEFTQWGNNLSIDSFLKLVIDAPIFSKHEIQRQVHLAYTLNLMSTMIDEFYNRNEQVVPNLERYSEQFDIREQITNRLDRAAAAFHEFGFKENSAWYSKSNAFSLMIVLDVYADDIANCSASQVKILKSNLEQFIENPHTEYSLAAREAVNNKRQRLIRHDAICELFGQSFS